MRYTAYQLRAGPVHRIPADGTLAVFLIVNFLQTKNVRMEAQDLWPQHTDTLIQWRSIDAIDVEIFQIECGYTKHRRCLRNGLHAFRDSGPRRHHLSPPVQVW